jgi:hypothetical protein
MTAQPDDHEPDEGQGRGEGGRRLDEDAAWRDIVAHWSETGANPRDDAPVEPGDRPVEPEDRVVEPVETTKPDPPRNPFDRTYLDLNTEVGYDDEGHFVPPAPPPLPKIEPRRKLAWIGVLIGPALLLLAAILRIPFPTWLTVLVVGGFVGGFVYLVATMPKKRHDDWSGDDGAVV